MLSDTATRLQTIDWAGTALGPRDRWPHGLRVAVDLCLDSRFPMFVWWGPELVNVYNDSYAPLLGMKHPAAFGRPAREVWADIWPAIGPQVERVLTAGEATWNERVMLVMQRSGYAEEAYFTWSYSPIRDDDGAIVGLLCVCKEDTPVILAERERDQLLAQVETERSRLASAFAQSPAFLAVLRGPRHVFEFVNERYLSLVGRQDIVGRPVAEALPEFRDQGFFELLDRVYRTGEPFIGTAVKVAVRRGDELQERYLDFVYQPMRDSDGTIAGILAHGVDVTAKHRAEERSREGEGRYRQIADELKVEKKALEMIAKGAPLGQVLDTIARGAESQSRSGMICSILVLDESGQRLRHGAAPGLPDAYNDAIDGLAIGPSVGSCGTAAFQRRPVFVTDIATDPLWADFRPLASEHQLAACCSTPILGSDDTVLGTVAMYYRTPRAPDAHEVAVIESATHLAGIVLEKERADRRLRQSLESEQAARSEAERASRMKDEFLATLSHELRTPLNAILGWTRILRLKGGIAPDVAQGVDVIDRNARAQATIIQDLLDMSAIISGKVRLTVVTMDVAVLVDAAIATAAPAAQAKNIRLDARIGGGGPVLVSGDASRLQQVLWNLISNAVKFTPRDGRIRVDVATADGHARIEVTDTGMGIAPEFLPFVFDRFRQADASTTRRHGGLGLGLAIVKQLVELHGGTVTVASDGPGHGATFAVTLPLLARDAQSKTDAAARESTEHDVAGVRVLVVDDDPDARDMVRRLLEEQRSVVVTAASSQEALDRLGEQRFDVLLSDIGMPGEDGLSLVRRVRALGRAAGGDLPAVALTAYARPEDRDKAMRAGFQVHIAKPIDPLELFAIVSRLARSTR